MLNIINDIYNINRHVLLVFVLFFLYMKIYENIVQYTVNQRLF